MTRDRALLIPDDESRRRYKLGPDANQGDLDTARAVEAGRAIRALYLLPSTASDELLKIVREKFATEGAKRMAREKI